MADYGNSDSAELQVILERIDPTKNVARYYVLSVEATLLARDTLVRRWGRIGSGTAAFRVLRQQELGEVGAGNVAGEKA
jgi:predicted DNA-binding WGR domain protein